MIGIVRWVLHWWSAAASVFTTTGSAERTYIVPAESRAYIVPADSRVYIVPAESRVYEVTE